MHKIRVAARHTRLAWSEPAVHQGFHGKLLIPNKIVDCFFAGNLSKSLICKASRAAKTIYQQSYPQKNWMPAKAFQNHELTYAFAS